MLPIAASLCRDHCQDMLIIMLHSKHVTILQESSRSAHVVTSMNFRVNGELYVALCGIIHGGTADLPAATGNIHGDKCCACAGPESTLEARQ